MRNIVHPISMERDMALVDRVKNILLSPRTEWLVIDAEPATVASLYTGYIMPLAAIPAICGVIGSAVFGVSIPFVGRIRVPITTAIVNALVAYVMTLVGAYVFAVIIDALAPSFGGTKNQVQALKVVAYSGTAAWVAGIFAIFPALFPLQIIAALYCLYLLFIGLPICMKAPQEKAIGYTAVSIICAFVLAIVIGMILGMLGMGMGGARGMGGAGSYRP
jgi:hypothetical protein